MKNNLNVVNPFVKKPLQSKKWIMSIIGLTCVMLVYVISSILATKNPGVATHVISLSSIVITFLGSLVGAYTIGQSFVDWKSTTNIENLTKLEHNKLGISADLKIIEHYERKYETDESYAPLSYTELN